MTRGRCLAKPALLPTAVGWLALAGLSTAIVLLLPPRPGGDGIASRLAAGGVLFGVPLALLLAGLTQRWEWDAVGVRSRGLLGTRAVAWAELVRLELSCGGAGPRFLLEDRDGRWLLLSFVGQRRASLPLLRELLRRWQPTLAEQRARLARDRLELAVPSLRRYAVEISSRRDRREPFGEPPVADDQPLVRLDGAGLHARRGAVDWDLPWGLVEQVRVTRSQHGETLQLSGGGRRATVGSSTSEYLAVAGYALARAPQAVFVDAGLPRHAPWQAVAESTFAPVAPPPAVATRRRALGAVARVLMAATLLCLMALIVTRDDGRVTTADLLGYLELHDQPAHARATVAELHGERAARHAHFRFTLPGGETVAGVRVGPGPARVGDTLDVLYAPSHPRANQAADQPLRPRAEVLWVLRAREVARRVRRVAGAVGALCLAALAVVLRLVRFRRPVGSG